MGGRSRQRIFGDRVRGARIHAQNAREQAEKAIRAADAVLVDLRQIGYAGGLHDPLGTLVMAGDCTVVDTTIVNGAIVVRDGRLALVSQARIVEDANRTSAAMVRRATARTGLTFGSVAPQLSRLLAG